MGGKTTNNIPHDDGEMRSLSDDLSKLDHKFIFRI